MTNPNIRIYWRNVKLERFTLKTKNGREIPVFVICKKIASVTFSILLKFYLNIMNKKIDLFRICTRNFGELNISLFLL